jgi:hypothetical protein
MTGLCLRGVVGASSLACVARSVVDYVNVLHKGAGHISEWAIFAIVLWDFFLTL